MSPTVDSSAYKSDNPLLRKFPPLIKTLSEASDDSSSSIDSSSNNGTTDAVGPSYRPLSNGPGAISAVGDGGGGGGLGVHSNAVTNLNSVSSSTSLRGSFPTPPKFPNGHAFPESASVSLPTSTTALDYLLHKHGMRNDSETPQESGSKKEGGKKIQQDGEGDSNVKTKIKMTKTLSATDPGSVGRNKKRDPSHVGHQFFHKESCLYTHRMFQRAAKIFEVLKEDDLETQELKASRRRQGYQVVEKGKIPEMDFLDSQEQIKTFELTFATLKFQKLFHEILEKTGFFSEYSSFRDDYGLVCIILYDLQSRKFQRRQPLPGEEEIDEVCLEIENALLDKKTRLLSHIAKERIKNNAPSIEYLLPEQVRNKDETKAKTPVYMWVNQLKTSLEDMTQALEEEGFHQLEEGLDISEQTTNVFRLDSHCSDLLVFPPHLDLVLKDTEWVKSGYLVQQDKSSCLAPQSVQFLLGMDQDVIHVNIGTGMTTGHLGSLLRKKSPNSHIFGFGVSGPDKAKKTMKNLEFLGAKNTKIIMDDFLHSDPEDYRFRNVKIIMISANCSKSAITSPVQFIVSEGEDMQILGELSKADSDMNHVGQLMMEHEKLLRHALKFSKVQAIVYATRSRHEAENESVVTKVLEYVNATSGKKIPFSVTPPVLPFSGDEINSEAGGVDGRYIKFLPSDKSNGCFVAILSREPEDPKEVVRSAIARAKTKGVLGKSKSANPDDTEEAVPETAVRHTKSGSSRRKTKGTSTSSEAKSGLRTKMSSHKTPAAIGARLYQAGLLSRMEQQAKQRGPRPEHVKVVKHPAPFSQPPPVES